MANIVDIRVWGEYACFTRPEFKVERVSYPCMTPSAARGILEAIYWKPLIRYRIQQIGILHNPNAITGNSILGCQWSLLRNEISSRQSETCQNLIVEDDRQQRTSLVLKDVAYRIQAWIELRGGENNIGKHLDSFRRRAEGGRYFFKPFLGCREFAADFEWLGCKQTNEETFQPLDQTISIGTMIFDTAYIEDPIFWQKHQDNRLEFWQHDNSTKYIARGYAKRIFFNAEIKNGWLKIPPYLYDQLNELEAR